MEVSVLLLTYKPNREKLFFSLNQIVKQKDVDMEIVISDDGSECNYYNEIVDFLEQRNIRNYKLIDNKENVGTVKNYIKALESATGKYVMATSPGDMLFDEYVLHDFFLYAEKQKCSICFGNAIYYNKIDKRINLTKQICSPKFPDVYKKETDIFDLKLNFYFEGYINGAVMFRDRIVALCHAKEVVKYSKYVEDTTTNAWALMEGTKILYYDRNMVWYEYGTGISTQEKNHTWTKIVKQDVVRTICALQKKYKSDKVLKAVKKQLTIQNAILRKVILTILYPKISLEIMKNRKREIRYSDVSEEYRKMLEKIMEEDSDYASN